MSGLIIHGDVELWATTYLRTALAVHPIGLGVFVSNRVPDPRRPTMVIVRRDGGARLDTVREEARLNVRVWASTDREATDLAALVRALMWAAPDGKPVVRVTELSGPTPVPDESGQSLRYLLFNVTQRGTQTA